jgi:hypothetical protein
MSWTRVRLFHFFGASHRFSTGPDVETYLETESHPSLGYGYTRVMPGWQFQYHVRGDFRFLLRARYEFSGGEDPGVSSLSRIVVRPTLCLPRAGTFTIWVRTDLAFYLDGGPNQYNVEGAVGWQLGRQRRLSIGLQPRIYVGAASRARNLARLRAGLTYSLGTLALHHPHPESD